LKRILISSVNGFIGSHIAERLVKEGHQVRGLVRKTSDLKFIEGLEIELFYGDITERDSLIEPMKGIQIVIHVAGLAADWGPYEKFYAVNTIDTKNMAEIASLNRVKRFVHISTTAIHGFGGFRDIDESFPMTETIFLYCETKKLAEKWLFEFSKLTDMEICAIRPGNVFGPRDHTFIDKYADALKERTVGYIDRGNHWTCPTYVENLVEGVIKACFEPAARGESFFITDGLTIDWKTFTGKLADELGLEPPRFSIPFWLGYTVATLMESAYRLLAIPKPPLLTRYRISNAGRDYHFCIEKAKRLLKYSPVVPFDEAIKRTAHWYRERYKENF